jgi:regulator of sirC expression with transglutaminase-like and TPR domain
MNLDDVLNALARDPSTGFDLAEVALGIAKEEYSHLDSAGYLAELDALAHDARNYARGPFSARVDGLCRYLFHELGFRGNKKDYYDPRNSYFNQVLDRRTGIPITLAAVMIAVGSRTGLSIVGVGLPGHFIVKCIGDDQEILVDPFHGGRRLSRVDCELLVRQTTGQEFHASDERLQALPLGLIVQRMLNNLRGIYLQREDWPRALRVLQRLDQLNPEDPVTQRDLGICFAEAGQPGRAIDPLRAYLRAAPDAEDVATVSRLLQQTINLVARWN